MQAYHACASLSAQHHHHPRPCLTCPSSCACSHTDCAGTSTTATHLQSSPPVVQAQHCPRCLHASLPCMCKSLCTAPPPPAMCSCIPANTHKHHVWGCKVGCTPSVNFANCNLLSAFSSSWSRANLMHLIWVDVQRFQAMFMEREGVTSHF